jgi:hypothetical protein
MGVAGSWRSDNCYSTESGLNLDLDPECTNFRNKHARTACLAMFDPLTLISESPEREPCHFCPLACAYSPRTTDASCRRVLWSLLIKVLFGIYWSRDVHHYCVEILVIETCT